MPGGYARTLAELGRALEEAGVDVRTGSKVAQVRSQPDGRLAVRAGDGTEAFDQVVVTATPAVLARLCPDLEAGEAAALEAVRYQGVVCTSVLVDRPLSGSYLTYLTDDLPITAIVEMTALVDPAQVGGHHLIYLPRYVTSDDPLLDATDDEVQAQALAGLRAVHPDLGDAHVLAIRTARARAVFPLPVLGYSETAPAVPTSVPGLSLVSSAQIVNGTLNADESIGRADTAVLELLAAAHQAGR